MGTFGTGPFSNDGALDLLDKLTGQPVGQRREALERIFFQVRDRPDLLGWKFFPDEIVAAAAIVAASVPSGEGIQRDLADQGYDIAAILAPAPDPALNASALEALLVAAGRDGPWHDGWVDPEIAAEARQTTDRLAAILVREEHLCARNLVAGSGRITFAEIRYSHASRNNNVGESCSTARAGGNSSSSFNSSVVGARHPRYCASRR